MMSRLASVFRWLFGPEVPPPSKSDRVALFYGRPIGPPPPEMRPTRPTPPLPPRKPPYGARGAMAQYREDMDRYARRWAVSKPPELILPEEV